MRYPVSATAAEKPLPDKGQESFPSWTSPTTLANSLVPGLYPPARSARQTAARGVAGWTGDLAYLAVTLAAAPITLVESLAGRGAAVMVQARPAPAAGP